MSQVYSDDPEVQAAVEALQDEFLLAEEAFLADPQSEEKLEARNQAMENLASARRTTRGGRPASIITE